MMLSNVASNHPVQRLLFFVAQDVDSRIRETVRRFVETLAKSRSWIIEPPQVIDTVDQPEKSAGDIPVETVGGELKIYSALSPGSLPRDVDAKHLEEVSALVEAVQKLSAESELAFEFELDGTFVGAIEDGKVSRTLQEGLLDEWRKHLNVAQ